MKDPIITELIYNGLTTIAEQMTARLIRSACSYIVKEMEDCSASIFDHKGELIAESAHVPAHLQTIGPCLKTILTHYYPPEKLKNGDLIITNDPYAGGKSFACHHTGDIIAYAPAFLNNKLVGFCALMVHHIDLGGMWMATRGWGVEIWQEGIRIPPCKLFKEGVLDEDILKMILNNTRVPDLIENDLRSQSSACKIATNEFIELISKHGEENFIRSVEELKDYSEKWTREQIGLIPDGTYNGSSLILEDGAKGGPYKLCVSIKVKGSDIFFDYSGTDKQIAGPINAPLSATYSATCYAMRGLTDPGIPSNEGCYRNIHIFAPEGTLVNCQLPAACFQRMVVMHALVDLVMDTLAPVRKEKVIANSCGCTYNYCNGIDSITKRRVMWGEVVAGGIGARSNKGGLNVMSCNMTNCPTPSIEALEACSPALYLQREFWQDSGGPGKYRGGLGQIIGYKILGDDPQFHHTSQRAKIPAQGYFGGKPGKSGKWIINMATPNEKILPYSIGDIEFLSKGDTVTQFVAGGGGYGNPLERDISAIKLDVLNGVVSVESAREDYGVIFDPKTKEIIGLTEERLNYEKKLQNNKF